LKTARKHQLQEARRYADVDEWDSEDDEDIADLPACPTCKQVGSYPCDEFYQCYGIHPIEDSFVTLFFSEEGDGDPVASVSEKLPINEDAKKQLALARLAQTYGIALDGLILTFKRHYVDCENGDKISDLSHSDMPIANVVRESMVRHEVQITKLLQDIVNEKSDQVLKVSANLGQV
jgi:hypothetical protein